MDGHALTYDEIGNPLSYYNGTSYTMDWTDGRKLTTLTKGSSSYTYKYDLNGIRSWKIGPDGKHKYIIVDGKAVGETVWDAKGDYLYNLRYTFDETGAVCGISQIKPGEESWTKYYFTKNLQGDVTGVYRANTDSTGIPSFTKVASYTYDSWGNVLTKSGEMADVNPFRYRSYYQDNETGFYYLKTRYYDPAIGRFINADIHTSTGQGFTGQNMFAYCGNNPVSRNDDGGEFWHAVIGAVVGAGVSAASELVSQVINHVATGSAINWGDVATSAVSGAVYGGIMAATGSNTAASMASTATASVINGVRNGDSAGKIALDTARDTLGTAVTCVAPKVINKSLSGKYARLNPVQKKIKKWTDGSYRGKFERAPCYLGDSLSKTFKRAGSHIMSSIVSVGIKHTKEYLFS